MCARVRARALVCVCVCARARARVCMFPFCSAAFGNQRQNEKMSDCFKMISVSSGNLQVALALWLSFDCGVQPYVPVPHLSVVCRCSCNVMDLSLPAPPPPPPPHSYPHLPATQIGPLPADCAHIFRPCAESRQLKAVLRQSKVGCHTLSVVASLDRAC